MSELHLKDVFDSHCPPKDGPFQEEILFDKTVFRHRFIKGCYLWKNAVPVAEQVELFHSCWFDYPEPPASTNLAAHYGSVPNLALSADEGLYLNTQATAPQERWSTSADAGPAAVSLFKKLRWCSLGPHYNWTSRSYETDVPYRPLPASLVDLWRRFLSCTCQLEGTSIPDWIPDVALINYYSEGDTLGGHKDDAEAEMTKPIVSLSLGSPGIFLMGGEAREETPTPILLRSGDVLVLHHQARRCFHGVPRVIHEENSCYQEYLRNFYVHNSDMKFKILSRISLSIRSLR